MVQRTVLMRTTRSTPRSCCHVARHGQVLQAGQGLGVITSPDLPAGFDAWVHFSAIEMDGYHSLNAGDPVEFGYEPAGQDRFRFVATRVRKL